MAGYHVTTAFQAAEAYRREMVESVLGTVQGDVAAGMIPEEALDDAIYTSPVCIYTAYARVYLLGSPNYDAWREQVVDTAESAPALENQAFFALEADVREHPDWATICKCPTTEAED